jgi:spore cortex formation protein SpoVR/YcgB (stage V sporulation)
VRRVEDAITAHQDAVAIYRETGDRHSEGIALNNLGLALREVRRVEEASVTPSDKWRFPDISGVSRIYLACPEITWMAPCD